MILLTHLIERKRFRSCKYCHRKMQYQSTELYTDLASVREFRHRWGCSCGKGAVAWLDWVERQMGPFVGTPGPDGPGPLPPGPV